MDRRVHSIKRYLQVASLYLNNCMIPRTITERLGAEYKDFDLALPLWLLTVLMDDVYYTVTLIAVCANSFCVGILIGWLSTL